jgi:cytoskeletal protein CcmA (bactofilin family)
VSFWKKRPQDAPIPAAKTGGWSSDNGSKKSGGSISGATSSAAAPAAVPEKTASSASIVTQPPISAVGSLSPEAALDAIEKRFGSVRSALGAGTNIQGKLSFDVAVRIDGELGGEVYSSQPVIIGPGGKVKASIQASSLIILGNVEGEVSVRDRVEILKGGALNGSVHAPVFVLEEDGVFNGTISMKKKQK